MRNPRTAGKRPANVRQRKPRGSGHERRREILAAATELFLSQGYETVTTRQLAHRAGLSQTGLYVYFRNKEEILEDLRRSTFERLGQRLGDTIADGPPGAALLQRLLAGYLQFALENADEYQLTYMVTHASLKRRERKDLTRPAAEQSPGLRVFLAFHDQIAKLMVTGVLRRGDPMAVTQALWGAVHGLATLLITHPTFPWRDHRLLIDTLVRTLVKGLQISAR